MHYINYIVSGVWRCVFNLLYYVLTLVLALALALTNPSISLSQHTYLLTYSLTHSQVPLANFHQICVSSQVVVKLEQRL